MLMVVGLLLFVGAITLISLGPTLQIDTQRVTNAPRIDVPKHLIISPHTVKHNGEAEYIYELLLEGRCATTTKYCGGSEVEKMYVCVDPVTGITGAILQFGDEITTGYFERDGAGYWSKRVEREKWEVCH